jgi:DNA-binding NarL/FixJ family response regulator
MERIRITVIDDHKLFVDGICSLLADDEQFQIVESQLSPIKFLNKFEKGMADVYLVDINMPEMSGIELARKVMDKDPQAKILALTMFDEFQYVEDMIKSGASGYVLKSASLEELTDAVITVSSGKKYFGNSIQEMMFNKIRGKTSEENTSQTNPEQIKLTKREIEILTLIVKEYTTGQIADKLFISERTVETHRKNIFSKTKAKSVIGLSKYAIKSGIIKLH